MARRIKQPAIVLGLCLLVTPGLEGGVFEVDSVIYNNQLNNTSLLVIAEGHAHYAAPQSNADSHALIQTTEIDTWMTEGEVGNSGAGLNVLGPFVLGQVISCTDAQGGGCPGRGFVPRRPCSEPPYAYHGRTGTVIYHQNTPEVRRLVGPTYLVPCIPASPAPQCGFRPWSEQRVLPVVGGPQLVHAFVGEPYALSRTEERDGFRYLLEEWTVVAVDREAGRSLRSIETLAASTTAYGDFLRDSLATTVEASSRPEWLRTFNGVDRGPLLNYFRPGRSIVLVVEAPQHFHNERWIPTPVVRWSAGATPMPGTPGRAVVRLDFAEDRSLARFDVLYADRPPSPAEQEVIVQHLGLEYASDKRHRAALFAVVSLGETIELERGIVVVQQCCCTGVNATCVPHPG